jgi:hypothetical protein
MTMFENRCCPAQGTEQGVLIQFANEATRMKLKF